MIPMSYDTVRLEHEQRLARIRHAHLAVRQDRLRRAGRLTKTYRILVLGHRS